MSQRVQLYGRFSGFDSHSVVSRGMAWGLDRNRIAQQIYTIDARGVYDNMYESIEDGGYRLALRESWQASAQVGVFIGGYPHMTMPWLDEHDVRVALVITESEKIPIAWLPVLRGIDLIVVPSSWVWDALIRVGIPSKQLMLVPHGVHPLFSRDLKPPPRTSKPTFLHIASSADFLERKGTPQLVEAFQQVFKRGEAKLVIRTPPATPKDAARRYASPDIDEIVKGVDPDLVVVDRHRRSLSPVSMIELLQRGWWALVQPSRAEAFGLIPVEARAVGVPVICTHCSGHAEHAESWDTVVKHGPPEWIQTNFVEDGMAPGVSADAIAAALRTFMVNPRHLRANAAANRINYADNYSWPVHCRELGRWLRRHMRKNKRPRSVADKLGIG